MDVDEVSMEYTTDNFTAQVLKWHWIDFYSLDWTDGINEWSLGYPTLGRALIALGVLIDHSDDMEVEGTTDALLELLTEMTEEKNV